MKKEYPLRLVEITPEGRIISALLEDPRSYGDLKSVTQLSHRWLSKKLNELSEARIIERQGDRYKLTNPLKTLEADPLFRPVLQRQISSEAKARLIAEEVFRDERIRAVILFGSLAKGQAIDESDIDLLIVTDSEMNEELNDLIYALMLKYDKPIEAVFLTLDDLIVNLQAKTTFSFSLLEGYNVICDRVGLGGLLSAKKRDLDRDWAYDEEAGAWFQKRPRPI